MIMKRLRSQNVYKKDESESMWKECKVVNNCCLLLKSKQLLEMLARAVSSGLGGGVSGPHECVSQKSFGRTPFRMRNILGILMD